MPTEVRAEPSQIKFFPGSDGDRVITRGNHGFELLVLIFPKLRNFLPIREQALVFEMRVRIERTERETVTRTQKLAERGVARHPGQLQSVRMRQVQGSPHGNADRASGSKHHGIAGLALGLFTMVVIPRSTRTQKSCQDSTPSTTNSPLTHMPMTASNICWKLLFRSSESLACSNAR